MNNRHVYLKNELTKNTGFSKVRNVQGEGGQNSEEEDLEISKLPNQSQQDRLRRSNLILYTDRKQRNEKRTIDVPATIEIVKIKFYKIFNNDLKSEFYKRYGLLASIYEDFNKTVFFEISNQDLFNEFIRHLELFYESPSDETYQGKEYNLIALIHDFNFLSSKRRFRSFSTKISSLSLLPPQNEKFDSIYQSLLGFLKENDKKYFQTSLSSEIVEVQGLEKDDVDIIINNFDIVKMISSTHTERRRPGIYGEERRDYGFTVNVAENLPIVGIIDSGYRMTDTMRPFLTNIQYDLTNTAAYMDTCGHGTTVANIVALGQEFINEIKVSYDAKAKIAVIKAIDNDNDELNIPVLIETILDAKNTYGIRLFNLSLNEPLPKGYNTTYSDFAHLLDKLAYENDILIFISVGNIPAQRLNELIFENPHVAHEYPKIFYSPEENSELHSCESTNISEPSESLNNISIGALAGNFEGISDITPAEEYPAYYTRKFHYDYEQTIHGSDFLRSQKNKHLNKPDLVFEGGDLFNYEAGIEVISVPTLEYPFYSRKCGTSIATPLVTSLAAEVLKDYPNLRTQTIKALLINSAVSPTLSKSTPPAYRGFPIDLFRKLIGFGRPENNLSTSNNNAITFIIESEIELEEIQTVIINLPQTINQSGNKLNFKGTLTYSFLPIKENHLGYLPLQITFGIFKPINASEMGQKADKKKEKKGTKVADYIIKSGMSWSDDFFGVDNRLFSNVQQIDDNVSGEQIESLGNKVSLGIRCTSKNEVSDTHKDHLKNSKHKFSIALTITELPSARARNTLYDEIVALNNVESIVEIIGEVDLEN